MLMAEELRWRRTSKRIDKKRFPPFVDQLCCEDAKISTKERVDSPDPAKAMAERGGGGDDAVKVVNGRPRSVKWVEVMVAMLQKIQVIRNSESAV